MFGARGWLSDVGLVLVACGVLSVVYCWLCVVGECCLWGVACRLLSVMCYMLVVVGCCVFVVGGV